MECIILVPGIEGSRLNLGADEVWPPTLTEAAFGYGRIGALMDSNTIARGILDQVQILEFPPLYYKIYKPLMDKLEEIAESLPTPAKHIDFFYDWRIDFWTSSPPFTAASEQLAHLIQASVASGASSITLVCHSMGCLVGRLVLESAKYRNTSWSKKIGRIICICGPHQGAPIALGRALACEGSSSGVSAADMKLLADDARYPAGYECFPAPGKDVLYDVSSGTANAVDIYSLPADNYYSLTRSNVLAAMDSYKQFDIDNHPKTTKYILIGGQGYSTSNAYLFNGSRYVQTITDDGDGIVPLWSSLVGTNVDHYTVIGDHSGIMSTPQLKQTLDKIFGLATMSSAFMKGQPGITVTVNKHTFSPDEMIEVVLIPDTPSREIDGQLRLSFAANLPTSKRKTKPELTPYGIGLQLTYKGPETSHLSARIGAPRIPGAYVLTFDGTHRVSENSGAVFFVNEPHPPSTVLSTKPQATQVGHRTRGQRTKARQMKQSAKKAK
jgi:hypothetical protein